MSKLPIILASTSPRRIQLLNDSFLSVKVQAPSSDEKAMPGEKPIRLVARLAEEKAESVRSFAQSRFQRSLIIAADTIVVSPDGRKILGKPKSSREARQMLEGLAGKVHTVFTAYCILEVKKRSEKQIKLKKVVRTVRSKVKMRPLNTQMIQKYVATGEPLDKAGAYGAQGLGMLLVEEIRGSYTNVVGLPMSHVCKDLEKAFGIPLFSWIS